MTHTCRSTSAAVPRTAATRPSRMLPACCQVGAGEALRGAWRSCTAGSLEVQLLRVPTLPMTLVLLSLPADVDGSALPFKALQVFLQHGSPATALSLLRQRDVGGVAAAAAAREGEGSGGGGGLQEASVAVAVLLGNGLLAEAYMQVRGTY